jgi:hypothetical protein
MCGGIEGCRTELFFFFFFFHLWDSNLCSNGSDICLMVA